MPAGRPPKPTALKELAGNPGKRPLNRSEPKPRVAIPRAPAWLSKEAKREYNRVAKMLVQLRVMTEADSTALALYAREYERYIKANRMIDETGEVVRGKASYYQSPWLHTANQAFKNLKGMLSEFGLTPASRTRISAMPEAEDTRSLAEMLFAGAMSESGDD